MEMMKVDRMYFSIRQLHRFVSVSTGRRLVPDRAGVVAHGRKEISQEELLRLVGGDQALLDDLMRDEPPEDETAIDPDMVPIKPGFLRPLPKKGSRNAKLHRKTDVLGRVFSTDQKPRRQRIKWNEALEENALYVEEDLKPVPWDYKPDLRLKEPFVYFPPKADPFCEKRTFTWDRIEYTLSIKASLSVYVCSYIPDIGDIYPEKHVEVQVSVTNDQHAVEAWEKERLQEGQTVYGLEAKWWMKERHGLYVTQSYPTKWADLALLQLSTEKEILLVQPLDMPVEKIEASLRQILKFKFIKKAGFHMKEKSDALKLTELKIHGCHDIFHLLKLQLGLKSIEDLPKDLLSQNLASMSKLLLGLDLKPRVSCQSHWEMDYLDDELIEIAAKEAWSCWALYGLITRMNQSLVEHWNNQLPKEMKSQSLEKEIKIQKQLMIDNGVFIDYIAKAEANIQRFNDVPEWKVAKETAVKLAHDSALNLEKKVDQANLDKETFKRNRAKWSLHER